MKTLQFLCMMCVTVLSLAVSSCSKEGLNNNLSNGDPAATMYQVNIQGGKFNPDLLNALPGHNVTWKNLDAVAHTVTSDDATSFNSGNINPGTSYSFITGTTGNYPYHCSIHPGERGVLNVITR